jgi:hypothetical protein
MRGPLGIGGLLSGPLQMANANAAPDARRVRTQSFGPDMNPMFPNYGPPGHGSMGPPAQAPAQFPNYGPPGHAPAHGVNDTVPGLGQGQGIPNGGAPMPRMNPNALQHPGGVMPPSTAGMNWDPATGRVGPGAGLNPGATFGPAARDAFMRGGSPFAGMFGGGQGGGQQLPQPNPMRGGGGGFPGGGNSGNILSQIFGGFGGGGGGGFEPPSGGGR